MKKLSLIPITLIILVGAVWASSFITPDKPGFPSNPVDPGTLGNILEPGRYFAPDGTAPNTLALSGITATGYVQRAGANCHDTGKVWMGLNTDGTVKCGTIHPLLVIGTFSEVDGTIDVIRNGTKTTISTGYPVQEGDIIQTSSNGTGTIDFDADDSIIRIASNTVVELRTGVLGVNTVAEAIVNSGSLWGRILTSTGVNIGGGGLIAGVRGTSISVKKVGANISLAIIDSAFADAATITNKNIITAGITPTETRMASGQLLAYTSGTTTIYPPISKTKSDLYLDDWIKQNTIKDIAYLTEKIDLNIPKIINELDITLPNDLNVLTYLTNQASNVTDPDDSDITTEPTSPSSRNAELKRKGKKTLCKKEGKRYWPSLDISAAGVSPTTPTDYCKTKDLVAFADYSNGSANPLYFRTDAANIILGSRTNITNIGDSLIYNLTNAQLASLTGKTITIKYNWTPVDGANILYLGGTYSISWDVVRNKWTCPMDFTCSSTTDSVTIKIPTNVTLSKFLVGNGESGLDPVGLNIKSIMIQ